MSFVDLSALREGRLVLRSPLANLATTKPLPGLVATVAVPAGQHIRT